MGIGKTAKRDLTVILKPRPKPVKKDLSVVLEPRPSFAPEPFEKRPVAYSTRAGLPPRPLEVVLPPRRPSVSRAGVGGREAPAVPVPVRPASAVPVSPVQKPKKDLSVVKQKFAEMEPVRPPTRFERARQQFAYTGRPKEWGTAISVPAGIGAAAGGVLGGPPGLVAGAAGGTLMGFTSYGAGFIAERVLPEDLPEVHPRPKETRQVVEAGMGWLRGQVRTPYFKEVLTYRKPTRAEVAHLYALGVGTAASVSAAPALETVEARMAIAGIVKKMPPAKAEQFKQYYKMAQEFKKVEAKPSKVDLTVTQAFERRPVAARFVEGYLRREDIPLGGTTSMYFQVPKRVARGMPRPQDVDIYTQAATVGKHTYAIAAGLRQRGVPRVQAFVRTKKGVPVGEIRIGKTHAVGIQPISKQERYIREVAGIFEPSSTAFARGPSGIRMLKLETQMKRKVIGGFIGARPKDIKHFEKIAPKLLVERIRAGRFVEKKPAPKAAPKAKPAAPARVPKMAPREPSPLGRPVTTKEFLGKPVSAKVFLGKPSKAYDYYYPSTSFFRGTYPYAPKPSRTAYDFLGYKPAKGLGKYPKAPYAPGFGFPYTPRGPLKAPSFFYPPYRPGKVPTFFYPPYKPPKRPPTIITPMIPPYAPPKKTPKYPPYAPPYRPGKVPTWFRPPTIPKAPALLITKGLGVLPKRFFGGFGVLVKRKGVWEMVSKRPLTRLSALGLGALATETAARTFRLVPVRGAGVRVPGFERAWRPGRFRMPFGKTTLPRGAFVEKTKFAIDVPRELREITYKGIAARSGMSLAGFFGSRKTKRRKRK